MRTEAFEDRAGEAICEISSGDGDASNARGPIARPRGRWCGCWRAALGLERGRVRAAGGGGEGGTTTGLRD